MFNTDLANYTILNLLIDYILIGIANISQFFQEGKLRFNRAIKINLNEYLNI